MTQIQIFEFVTYFVSFWGSRGTVCEIQGTSSHWRHVQQAKTMNNYFFKCAVNVKLNIYLAIYGGGGEGELQ